MILTRALGYGTYVFMVRDTSQLDPAAAFGMLTWDDQGAEQNHRELDIEFSQWGDPGIANAQYVRPAVLRAGERRAIHGAAGTLDAFVPVGAGTRVVQDRPGCRRRRRRARRASTSSRPACRRQGPNGPHEPVFLPLLAAPPQKDVEVVIERFQYLP